jgi:RNA polymerase sigma-70 factor (sigma-E family)
MMMATVAMRDRAASDVIDGAVAALWREHYRPLVRLAALLLDDVGASEEVVQDAFVRLHVGWGRLRDADRAPAWLRSAVLNGARSRLRRRQVARRHISPVPRHAESAETGALVHERHRAVIAALRRLPDRQREALALKFYLDLSEAEMAEAMGVSAGSVKTHVHRGLAALSELLEAER